MEFEEISQTHCSQCPAQYALVRRNVEVRIAESRNSKVELAAPGPEVSLQLSSYVCRDCGVCMAHHYHDEEEREDDAVYIRGEDMEREKDKDLGVTGTVKWAEPRGTSFHQATTSDRTSQAYSDLCKQVDDLKLQTERERSKNTKDVHECSETMQSCTWGLPGSRAPNCPLATVRRTKCLHTAGILPQEQIRAKGFSGTPFRLP